MASKGALSKKPIAIEDRALAYLQQETNHYADHGNLQYYQVPRLNLNKKPWIDKWDVESVMSLYQRFPWNCDYPKPLLPAARLPRTVLCSGDPGTDFLLTKKYVAEDVRIMTQKFTTSLKDFSLKTKGLKPFKYGAGVSQTKLPRFVADLAEIMDRDPDDDFNGDYNYYFNGGSLDCVTIGGENILIFPYVDELIAAPLLPRDGSIWKPSLTRASKWKVDGQIFEIKHVANSPGYKLMTRSKHQVEFFDLIQKSDKLKLVSTAIREYNIPLITADLNQFNPAQYCAIAVNGSIRVRDVQKKKEGNRKARLPTVISEDHWRSVKYHKWNPNIMTLVDRCCVHYIDLRKSITNYVLTMCPKDYLNNHELISLEVPSDREGRHYIGTYLSLLMMDSRYPEDPVQQKWTHQLQSAPIMGNVMSHGGREVLTLSTQLAADTRIILNTWEDRLEPHNFHLPYKPPSILDTLRECHLLGKCLDPMLGTRLKLSTAGTQLLVDDAQNIYYFTQNSVGDIFYQGLNYDAVLDKNSYINTNAYYALEIWEKRMLEQNKPIAPLVMCDQANMKMVFDAFSNKTLNFKPPVKRTYKDREFERPPIKARKRKIVDENDKSPAWKQSIKRLSLYTDLLAPSLLATWEVTGSDKPMPQAASTQKVLSWLEKSDAKFYDAQLSQESIKLEEEEEDDCVLTPVFSQDLVSVSQQEVRNDYRVDSEIVDDPEIKKKSFVDENISYFSAKSTKRKKELKRNGNSNSGF